MKKRSNVYTILLVFLLLIQQIISGCATTATKDVSKESLNKEELYKKDMQKEELSREDLHKEVLVKEELHEEEAGLASQKLYQAKCSLCHEMQDIDAYAYSPEQWVKIIDAMHNPGDYSAIITSEEDKKIKDYLGSMSQKK